MDTLRHIRELPDDILANFHRLLVNRKGNTPDSFMVTEDIVGYVAPGRTYVVTRDAFMPTDENPGEQVRPAARAAPPPHARVRATWHVHEDIVSTEANIFGGLGTLTMEQPVLELPEAPATAEALAYYGARLLRVGDRIAFETAVNLPVTIMNIGGAYVEQYLKVQEKGGGTYLEYHDLPHIHMPLDDSAGGHLILARREGDAYRLSAFRFPQGHAIYTAPNALHADAYLVGRYLVVYGLPEQYSTVVLRTADGVLVDMRVAPTW